MDKRRIPWKAEWKAAGLDPGPLTEEEAALVPQLEAENLAFLEKHPLAPPRRPSPVLSPWAMGLAAAALLLFVVPFSQPESGLNLEHIKGGDPVLTVYRQGKGSPEKLATQALVKAGDVLQAAYQVSRELQGALLSVDGDNNVTVHLAREGRSIALVPGNEQHLDFSYELDRAPKYEVFFLLTSDKPFDIDPARQTLKSSDWKKLAPGAFGSGIRFTVVVLNKGARP